MRSMKAITVAVAAIMGLASVPAFAQGNDRRGDDRRDWQRNEQRRDQRGDQRHDQRNNPRGDQRGDQRFGNDRDNRGDGRNMGNRDGRADNNRGYSYGARGAEWRRGGHVPYEYRSRQYVVNDWRGHRLNAPPRGHQWVQVGSDYVVAIATGLIVNLILSQ